MAESQVLLVLRIVGFKLVGAFEGGAGKTAIIELNGHDAEGAMVVGSLRLVTHCSLRLLESFFFLSLSKQQQGKVRVGSMRFGARCGATHQHCGVSQAPCRLENQRLSMKEPPVVW